MSEKTLNDILADFGPKSAEKSRLEKEISCISIRVSPEAKERYRKLQDSSGRRFSKKAREALLALIEAAEARTA